MSENVKVCVRVRPFNKREKERGAKCIIGMQGTSTTIKDPSKPEDEPKAFNFDNSYWSHDGYKEEADGTLVPTNDKYDTQQTVFEDVGNTVLTNAYDGFNTSLFAYGQTGSGKSYSMVGYGPNKGIVPIAFDSMFKKIAANTDDHIKFQVTFSMIEIYMEAVADLLTDGNKKLKVRQNPKEGGFFVDGVLKIPVSSYEEIDAQMNAAMQRRTVAATQMNATSSRAHTVVTMVFSTLITDKDTGKKTTRASEINLVDLAGSERANSTGATGARLKEGAQINLSLSALGNVISALATGKKNIPFRDSVLTKLLKNSLGGNAKTIMIAALSPADINFDETLSTLRYADRAKQIKNKAVVNESATDKLIRNLKEENEKMRAMLDGKMPTGNQTAGMSEDELAKMKEETEANIRAGSVSSPDDSEPPSDEPERPTTFSKGLNLKQPEGNLYQRYPRCGKLGLLVLGVLPWVWPVSTTPDPAGGNTTAGGSCLDPDSDNYLDCCDEYGVALKPYWVLLVSAFIFAFLLGTTKTNDGLRDQIRQEGRKKRVALAARREAAKERGFCCQLCCVSRLPFDCWARCPPVTWFDCQVKKGTPTADLISKAKDTGKAARIADAEARDAEWTQGCCGRCFKGCCGDDATVAAATAFTEDDKKEIDDALTEACKDRNQWVWCIVGIQLLVAIVSTAMLVVELRTRGIQGWELYQAVTLLSYNSTLGSFLAATLGMRLRFGVVTIFKIITGVKDGVDIDATIFDAVRSEDDIGHANSVDIVAIFDCFSSRASIAAGGIGICTAITHISVGTFLFLPYIAAGFLFTACFGFVVSRMLTMPGVACGKNEVPERTILNSAGEALSHTVWILVATGYFVTAATLTVQYYDGVPWEQAIVNDWEARTSAKYVGCLARQLSGTVTNTQSNAVAFTDFIGIVL